MTFDLRERPIPPLVSTAPAFVTAAIHFDDKADGWGEHVHDVAPEQHDFPAEVNAKPPCGDGTPEQQLRRVQLTAQLPSPAESNATRGECGV